MVDAMVEWFFENYEDPAESVPYDSGAGGYQYIGGGPYEVRDVLYEQFDGANDKDIENAVLEINSRGGPDWVKISDYSFSEYDQEDDEEDSEEDSSSNWNDELTSSELDSPF